jgi:hypothetical protein
VPSSGLGGISGRIIYGHSWKRALLIGILLSYGAVHFLAAVLEHRSMMNPSGQYKAFYYGDLVCLPGIVVAVWYLGQHMPPGPNLSHRVWWHAVWFAAGLAAGVYLHLMDGASHFYTRSMMYSPTKLYHDFVVFPLYIYLLFSAGLPAFAMSEWRSKRGLQVRLVVLVLAAAFIGLNVWDNYHRPHSGQVNYNWSKFPFG